MRVLNHPPMFLSALIVLFSQSVSAAALDKNVKNILLEEAAETNMAKGVTINDTTADPSIIPNAGADYDALEASITSQIKQALGNDKAPSDSTQSLQNQLELDLEKVVSSALLQGNKLDDIRNAVAAAMSDIKATDAAESEIPVDKIQSAELALKEIVSEEVVSEEVETVETKAVLPKSTMSAVDSILAAMSKTTVEANKPTQAQVQVAKTPEVKPTQVDISSKPAPIEVASPVKVEIVKNTVEEAAEVSKPKLVALETTTVGEGETLFKVAKRVYGSGKKYLALYEANKDTIKNPDIIFVGQVLKVPR